MKGIVFTTFNDMIEKEFGIDTWEEILTQVNPDSAGIYTSVEDYKDNELFSMVTALSGILDKPATELVEHFGYYLFNTLATKYSVFVETCPDLFSFLESIDGVIHKEVEKLYVNPNLPNIQTQRKSATEMTMIYDSPRKLCYLATGLVKGAANYYQNEIAFNHDKCMHEGFPECHFTISLS